MIRWKARDSLDNHGSGGGVAIRRYVCRGSVRLLTILVLRCYGVTLLPTGRIIVDYTLYSFAKENTRFFSSSF